MFRKNISYLYFIAIYSYALEYLANKYFIGLKYQTSINSVINLITYIEHNNKNIILICSYQWKIEWKKRDLNKIITRNYISVFDFIMIKVNVYGFLKTCRS